MAVQRGVKNVLEDPSPEINVLSQNIVSFLRNNPIGCENIGPLPSHQPSFAKLVKSRPWNQVPPVVYNVQCCSKPVQHTVPAYFLGYRSISIQGNSPAFIDIPYQPAAHFLFTGELSGCSVIVTRHQANYRVYHDARYCSSVLYDKVEMAIDYLDYAEDYSDMVSRKIAVATACMNYDHGGWTLYTQFLNENEEDARNVSPGDVPDCKRVLRWKGAGPMVARNSYQAPDISGLRESLFESLKAIMIEYCGEASIPNVSDGAFEHFDVTRPPSLMNPAVARTESLRTAMKTHRLDAKIRELVQRGRKPDIVLRQFLRMQSDSQSTDATYLWLRMKQVAGTLAVVNNS